MNIRLSFWLADLLYESQQDETEGLEVGSPGANSINQGNFYQRQLACLMMRMGCQHKRGKLLNTAASAAPRRQEMWSVYCDLANEPDDRQ